MGSFFPVFQNMFYFCFLRLNIFSEFLKFGYIFLDFLFDGFFENRFERAYFIFRSQQHSTRKKWGLLRNGQPLAETNGNAGFWICVVIDSH